jgi:D-sedoheptulose 7-phosphate isomerase
MIIGNAELAAIASHLASNLVIRFKSESNRQSLPAMSLCSDPVVMTAAAKEFGYDEIFSRQIEGLGHKGDMLFILSVNGNSGNLISAIKTAQHKNIITTAFLGGSGGTIAKMVERSLIIPHPSEQRVIEEMMFILHLMVELVESDLFA